jgi:hypothetical protein
MELVTRFGIGDRVRARYGAADKQGIIIDPKHRCTVERVLVKITKARTVLEWYDLECAGLLVLAEEVRGDLLRADTRDREYVHPEPAPTSGRGTEEAGDRPSHVGETAPRDSLAEIS